jgi:hypothetical protein
VILEGITNVEIAESIACREGLGIDHLSTGRYNS